MEGTSGTFLRQKFDIIFNHSNDAILVLNSDLKIVEANPAFGKISGYLPNEIKDADLGILFKSGKNQPAFTAVLNDADLNGIEKKDLLMKCADGKMLRCELDVSAVYGDGIKSYIVFIKPVSGLNQTVPLDKSAALTERVKELHALSAISQLITSGKTMHAILQEVVDTLPASWQFPEITRCRLKFRNTTFISTLFSEGKYRQAADINVSGEVAGCLEIFYTGEAPLADEGPFLAEERNLINNIVMILGKYLEQEQSRKEMRLRSSLINAAGDAIIATDSRGKIIYWNRAAENMYGWKEHEILGGNIMQITVSEKMKRQATLIIRNLREGKSWTGEFLVRNKSGDEFPALVTDSPFYDENNELAGIIGVSRDISDRKLTETRLLDFTKRLRHIAANLPGMIFQYREQEGKAPSFNYVSGACYQLYGFSPQQVMDDASVLVDNVHPDDKKRVDAEIAASMQKLTAYHSEHRVIRPDGSIKWIDASSIPELQEDGSVLWTGVALDATERKTIENKLSESEMNFRDIADNIPGLVYQFRMTADGRFEFPYVNQYATAVLDLDDEEISDPRQLFARIVSMDNEAIMQSILHSAQTLNVWEEELKFITDEGRAIWLHGISRPRRFNDGSVLWNGVMIDITEIKEAEAALAENEERLREAQHIARMGNYEIDVHTKILHWSQGIFELLDMDPEKVPYHVDEFNRMVAADDRWKVDHYNEDAINKRETTSFDLRLFGRDGREIFLAITGKPIFDDAGQVCRIVGIAMDITARKKTEILLEKSRAAAVENEQSLMTIFNNTPLIMMLVDPEGRIVQINQTGKNISVISPDKILGLHAGEIMNCVHALTDGVKCATAKVCRNCGIQNVISLTLDTGKSQFKKEIELHAGFNGRVTPLTLLVSTALMKRDHKTHVLLAVDDITERKQLENDLMYAKEKAEESDRLKSAFLLNISHEIRTPMNGILGFTDLLKDPEITPDEMQHFIGVIEQSGERMLNTVNDLMDISKIEAGQVEPEISTVNLNNLLDELYFFHKPEADEKQLEFSCFKGYGDHQSKLLTDGGKLSQILSNLIKNALKFTPFGSIAFGCRQHNGSPEFFVKDTGIGIAPDRHEAIFERFVQADITLTRPYEGTGLGLSIVKAYVHMLGGEIRVESDVDQGAHFIFTIKSGNHEKTQEYHGSKTGAVHALPLSGLKVLIVEDTPSSDAYLTAVLNSFSSEILHAADGLQAVEMCRKCPDIDLVLMDVKMPGLDGYSATARIREFNTGVVIIAQTAFALPSDEQKALRAGCNSYLSKPVRKSTLLNEVAKWFPRVM